MKCVVVLYNIHNAGTISHHDMDDYLLLTNAGSKKAFEPVYEIICQLLQEGEPEKDLTPSEWKVGSNTKQVNITDLWIRVIFYSILVILNLFSNQLFLAICNFCNICYINAILRPVIRFIVVTVDTFFSDNRQIAAQHYLVSRRFQNVKEKVIMSAL